MARALTIGLRYKHQDAWAGGVYYVQNLVRAFGLLSARERPRLVIVGGDKAALEELRAATGYPALERLSRTRIHPEPARRRRWPFAGPREEEIDLLLMGSPPGLEARGVQWIPDLQELRFPGHFPPEELAARLERNARWLAGHRHVMVSSRDVAEELTRHYGRHGNRVHIVPFASFPPPEPPPPSDELRGRYGLPDRYFLCANQFWRHKNHARVLRALAEAGPGVPPVAFTGREEDYRDPDHAPGVRRLAAELGLEAQARFLGFIPRADQLGLMAGAVAVIQPSLSEGWSTAVEDAKALGRWVLASDIAVHREQLDRNVDFFPGDDAAALARLLVRYAAEDPEPAPVDYQTARRKFAEGLLAMAREVERDFRGRRVDRFVIRR